MIKTFNPYDGDYPEFYIYRSASELIRKTSEAIERLVSIGYKPEEIIVLTGAGRSKSVLLALSKIGNYQIKKFTGTYDDNAEPIWTDGEILVDTIYRFKGQSAPAIILSEMDFSNLDDIERRKLFVGLTRGQMAINLVISERSEEVLKNMLNQLN
jgi:superfamily I DNA and RNA helicase